MTSSIGERSRAQQEWGQQACEVLRGFGVSEGVSESVPERPPGDL